MHTLLLPLANNAGPTKASLNSVTPCNVSCHVARRMYTPAQLQLNDLVALEMLTRGHLPMFVYW